MESINRIPELGMQVRWATASDYLNAAYPSLLSPPDPSPRPFAAPEAPSPSPSHTSGVLIERMGALVSNDPAGDALPYHGECVCVRARACVWAHTITLTPTHAHASGVQAGNAQEPYAATCAHTRVAESWLAHASRPAPMSCRHVKPCAHVVCVECLEPILSSFQD